MTCFRVDVQEPDRAGNHPMMFQGKYIGVSCEPFTSAAQWLTRNKNAKPSDCIDLRAGGVQLQYGRISSIEAFGRRAEKDDSPGDDRIVDTVTDEDPQRQPQDENVSDEELNRRGREIAREIERRRKLRQKKVADDLEDTSQSPSEDLSEDESASLGDDRYRQDTRYRQQVDAAAAYITRVHSVVTTGQAPQPKPAASVDDMIALAPTLPYPQRVQLLAAAITQAGKNARGEV